MTVYIKDPAIELAGSQRFMARHTTNVVAALQQQMCVDEETAWSVAVNGFLDALAAHLAKQEEPSAQAHAIAEQLGARVGIAIARREGHIAASPH